MTICTLQKLGLQKLLLYICVVHYLENVYKLVKILLKFIAAPYIHSSILHLKHGDGSLPWAVLSHIHDQSGHRGPRVVSIWLVDMNKYNHVMELVSIANWWLLVPPTNWCQ